MKKKFSKILGIALSIALVTSLLVAAVPAIALSTPTVDVAPSTISNAATYTVEFEVSQQLTGNGTLQDTITFTFPAGTVIAAPTATIVSGPGWVDTGTGPVWYPVPDDLNTGSNWAFDPVLRTITYTMPNGGVYVGSSADVRVEITVGITNPGTPGDYTLTVKTSQETTAKTSETYAITIPVIHPLSGIVSAYNDAGILMAQSHDIQECITAASVDGRVEIGPGTYSAPVYANIEGQTIIGIGDPGTVIIQDAATGPNNALRIEADDVTLDSLTLTPGYSQSNTLISVHGDDATITNCDLTTGGDTSSAIYVGTGNPGTVISNTTIDTTSAGAQNGIKSRDDIVVTDCMFTVGAGDTAIDTRNDATITGATITGSSGTGIYSTGDDVTIDGSTFTSLDCALYVDGGETWLKNSVVDGCGSVGDAAIVNNDEALLMVNNTIQNSFATNNALDLEGFSSVHFNSILNNPMNVSAGAGNNFLANNWWGSADGPAPGTVI